MTSACRHNLPSSASIVSPGSTFSSSEYSASEIAAGFASSIFFSTRSLPSQPVVLRAGEGVSCASIESGAIFADSDVAFSEAMAEGDFEWQCRRGVYLLYCRKVLEES